MKDASDIRIGGGGDLGGEGHGCGETGAVIGGAVSGAVAYGSQVAGYRLLITRHSSRIARAFGSDVIQHEGGDLGQVFIHIEPGPRHG